VPIQHQHEVGESRLLVTFRKAIKSAYEAVFEELRPDELTPEHIGTTAGYHRALWCRHANGATVDGILVYFALQHEGLDRYFPPPFVLLRAIPTCFAWIDEHFHKQGRTSPTRPLRSDRKPFTALDQFQWDCFSFVLLRWTGEPEPFIRAVKRRDTREQERNLFGFAKEFARWHSERKPRLTRGLGKKDLPSGSELCAWHAAWLPHWDALIEACNEVGKGYTFERSNNGTHV